MISVIKCRLCDVEFAGNNLQDARTQRTAHIRRSHLKGRKDADIGRWVRP